MDAWRLDEAGGWSAVNTVDVREGLFDVYLPLVLRGTE